MTIVIVEVVRGEMRKTLKILVKGDNSLERPSDL